MRISDRILDCESTKIKDRKGVNGEGKRVQVIYKKEVCTFVQYVEKVGMVSNACHVDGCIGL